MLNKTIVVLGLCTIITIGMQSSASAGGRGYSGYDGLWWNGPDGTDHNVLFSKSSKYKSYSDKSCSYFKAKYVSSGKKYWLRKFEICEDNED